MNDICLEARKHAKQRSERLALGHFLLPYCNDRQKEILGGHLSVYCDRDVNQPGELPPRFENEIQSLDKKIAYRRIVETVEKIPGPWRHLAKVFPQLNIGLPISESNPTDTKKNTSNTLEESSIETNLEILTPLDATVEVLRKQLEQLIGLNSVKSALRELSAYAWLQMERSKVGLKCDVHLPNMIFKGNPGTGKTTIVHLFASILFKCGVLKTGNVVIADRGALIAGYTGQTAIKTKQVIESSQDSILFVDEAYDLDTSSTGGGDPFGEECITTLLPYLTKPGYCVVLAGYPGKMDTFLSTNPGLKSRFETSINFPDYSKKELFKILLHKIRHEQFSLNLPTARVARKVIDKVFESKQRHFGNGRAIENLVRLAIRKLAVRVKNIGGASTERLMRFEPSDFELSDFEFSDLY